MMPIVFWASLLPCENERSAELASCAGRKNRSTRAAELRLKSQNMGVISEEPRMGTTAAETTRNEGVWIHFSPHVMASGPPRATGAPAYPPMSACEELEGMP